MYVVEKDSLVHYGVSGMKWGVRHERKSEESKGHGRLSKAKAFAKRAASNKKVQNVAKVAGTISTSVAIAALFGTPIAALGATAAKSALSSIGSIGINSALDQAKAWGNIPVFEDLEIKPLVVEPITVKEVNTNELKNKSS